MPPIDVLFPILAALLGLILGSFYNVCIHRYIMEESIVWPPSHCPACGKRLKPWELVPVVSWLALRGRCSGCKAPISMRYPVVELVSGAWALLLALKYGPSWPFAVYMAFGGAYIVAAFIDFELYILPDIITLPAAALAIPAAYFLLGVPVPDALIGAAVGAGIFWLLLVFYKHAKGVEGMGLGDVKLMLSIGGLLGWKSLPFVTLCGSLTALVASIVYIRARGEGESVGRVQIPFGPFLSGAAMVYMLYGAEIWRWYLGR